MSEISEYEKTHEEKLITLMLNEPDWNSLTSEDSIGKFKQALLDIVFTGIW